MNPCYNNSVVTRSQMMNDSVATLMIPYHAIGNMVQFHSMCLGKMKHQVTIVGERIWNEIRIGK
jgi:hypothetical protein